MAESWETRRGSLNPSYRLMCSESSEKIEWRMFGEARAFARSLRLKSKEDWVEWSMSKERPRDIPADPLLVYGEEGGPWQGWPDFLGCEAQGGGSSPKSRSLPFEEARDYVSTLGLKSVKEWGEWIKSGEKPYNIPSRPDYLYKDKGWLSWPDFLGYNKGHVARARTRRSFTEALGYVRNLGLKSQEDWLEFVKSGEKPSDIPSAPDKFYKDKGWLSWGDFLGFKEGYVPGEYRPFEEARDYVWTLDLKSQKEWWEWVKTQDIPPDIPSTPHEIYKEEGWKSWGDFLGFNEGYVPGEYRPFEEARMYMWSLGLESYKEWREWKKSGERPSDIPSSPNEIYKDEGWLSHGDFLGYRRGHIAIKLSTAKKLSFEEARDYVRTLGLKSQNEWWEWTKSGKRPPDIPSAPYQFYKGKGWLSWPDFLGYRPGYVPGDYRTFEEARDYVWGLGLKSQEEWREWRSKSGLRPSDIPSHPDQIYKDEGWLSWGDFLGYNEGYDADAEWLPFEEARDYVWTLGLKSHREWQDWSSSKSGERPSNVPSNPDIVYKGKGWLSWGDFLGYGRCTVRKSRRRGTTSGASASRQ